MRRWRRDTHGSCCRASAPGSRRRSPTPSPEKPDDGPRDASDDAADLFDEELGEGIADRLRAELAAIERAEKRLDDGTYGLSVESGEPIPDGRLEAIPWAERTAAEQERYEGAG